VEVLRKLKVDVVGAAFVIDLPDLGGSGRLARHGIECHTLMSFEGD
jgi:adenine phosphoribosyltransferase